MTLRIVITSFGSYGDLNPYLGLGRALAARGHTPVLALPASYRSHVESAGLHFHAVAPDVDVTDRVTVARAMHPLRGADFLVRHLVLPHLEAAYHDLEAAAVGADLLVSHPLTFAAPLLAERRGLPWASSVLAPLNFFSRSDPPLVAPSRALDALLRRRPSLYASLIPLARRMTRQWTTPVRQLRRALSLPAGGHPLFEGQFSPHLVLAMFSRHLATPQPDWPPNTVVTGAIPFDAIHGPMPDAMRDFLDAGDPPVVFTLGSAAVGASHAATFFRVSVQAAQRLGLRAILLTGREAGHQLAVGHDARILVAEWAPHSALFPRASVIVHQGGAGTLHTALGAGRPMLIVPFAHDQPDNARRTEALAVARVVFPQHYTSRRLEAELGTLVRDPAFAAHAAHLAARVNAERGAPTACDALEALGERA